MKMIDYEVRVAKPEEIEEPIAKLAAQLGIDVLECSTPCPHRVVQETGGKTIRVCSNACQKCVSYRGHHMTVKILACAEGDQTVPVQV